MNTWWAVDAVLMGVLFMTVILMFLFHSRQVGRVRRADPSAFPPAKRFRIPLYPGRLIRQGGFSAEHAQWLYWALKLAAVILAVALLLEVPDRPPAGYLYVLVCVLAFFLVDFWLLGHRRRRRRRIDESLGFFINLMIIYLETGANLSQAFRLAARYGLDKSNPLAEEVTLIAHELDAGRNRQRAFYSLADRTGVAALERLAAVIATGIETGNPMPDLLRSQADLLLAQHRQQAAVRVNRKVMESMLPLLLTCVPVFVALVVYPAGVQILDVLQVLGDIL